VPESHVVGRAWAVGAERDFSSTDGHRGDAVPVVIPARGGAGKSRLRAPAGVDHGILARAMAQDTITAALACSRVSRGYVVSGDARLAAWAGRRSEAGGRSGDGGSPDRERPCRVLADPANGLGRAIDAGLRALGDAPVAAILLADLPALTAADLDAALAASLAALPAHGAAFVPDAEGTGTVLLVGEVARLRPAFGPDSAAAHARHAVRLDLDLPRLRRDVDDAADLASAVRLGVGRHTSAALSGVALVEPGAAVD